MVTINKYTRFTKRAFVSALIIIVLLTIISIILLAIRLIDYINIDRNEVLLNSNFDNQLDLFSVQYENTSGEITVSGIDGEKVVAPGTSMEYTIRLRNKDKIAIDYELIPNISYTSDHAIPILIRMLDDNGEYIIGDAKTWVTIDEIITQKGRGTLLKGQSAEYVFQWKWEFESGDDYYDTQLGNDATKENIGISVKFDLHAEANTDIGVNGGVIESGLGDIIFAAVVLVMLAAAITLMILIIVKNKKHTSDDETSLNIYRSDEKFE